MKPTNNENSTKDMNTNNELQPKSEQSTSPAPSQNDEQHTNDKSYHYNEGDLVRMVRVRFPGDAKSYSFTLGKRQVIYGQKVVAMSDRGLAVGYINSFPYNIKFKNSLLPLKGISKIANDEDIAKEKDAYKKQKETEKICQQLIEKHNLDMNLTHVEFTQFGNKVVFYFIAQSRVDFRELVKDLVKELKVRIELRQISVRDRAASQGAIGPCGRELCCSSFLTKYGNVSIKLAKNQNLSLNASKLNGVCGQLKCCLQYEDQVYTEKRKKLPKESSLALMLDGHKGKVQRLNILLEQFDVLCIDGVVRRYVSSMFDKALTPDECKMPKQFDHIKDNTSKIIGLNQEEEVKAKEFAKQIDELKNKKTDLSQLKEEQDQLFESDHREENSDLNAKTLNEKNHLDKNDQTQGQNVNKEGKTNKNRNPNRNRNRNRKRNPNHNNFRNKKSHLNKSTQSGHSNSNTSKSSE